jgi:hypothetical protein
MSADVDIDFVDRTAAIKLFPSISAARVVALNDGKLTLTPHNSGIYLQEIPHHPISNIATVDFREADARGYFKIDFLNVSVYEGVRDEAHLIQLLNQEPMWELLTSEEFVDLLFHVNGHIDTLKKMQPKSIEQLAAVLAALRPAKRHLIGKPWDEVLSDVWVKPSDEKYYFKKSHSISYAAAIVVQMNLICEQAN